MARITHTSDPVLGSPNAKQPQCSFKNLQPTFFLHGGSASSILPVLHVLQERVFPRLAQTAMQVGGFCKFERLSLCADQDSDGLEYNHMRMTTEQCLEYRFKECSRLVFVCGR